MTKSMTKFDVTAIGNAIVDLLTYNDDAFLVKHNMPKGGFNLIDQETALAIHRDITIDETMAGGSAANTMAVLAGLGGKANFVGKIGNDDIGKAFRTQTTDIGVAHNTLAMDDDTPTGRCTIIVTPDAERSMATFIGAAEKMSVADLVKTDIEASQYLYFEGYLFEQDTPRTAFIEASKIANAAGNKCAMTLSDAGVVARQYDALLAFLTDNVDVVFCNLVEAQALAKTTDHDEMVAFLSKTADTFIVTRSADPTLIIENGVVSEHKTTAPSALKDTTGAGDAFAGGYLYGVTHGMDQAAACDLGNRAASEIISKLGPRPQIDLKTLLSS